MTSDGGVYISTAQIFDELREVHATVRGLVSRIEDLARNEQAVLLQQEKDAARLSSLEKWRWGLTGGLAVALGGTIGSGLRVWLGA